MLYPLERRAAKRVHSHHDTVDAERHDAKEDGKRDGALGLDVAEGPPVSVQDADDEHFKGRN